jgi:hypothetical protein
VDGCLPIGSGGEEHEQVLEEQRPSHLTVSLEQEQEERGESMKTFYVGWTGAPWRVDLLPEPTAPSNYRDEAKIARVIEVKREKQVNAATTQPFFGQLHELFIIDNTGAHIAACVANTGHQDPECIYRNQDFNPDTSPSEMLVHFMTHTFDIPPLGSRSDLLRPDVLTLRGGDHDSGEVEGESAQVFGFGIKLALRMAAMKELLEKVQGRNYSDGDDTATDIPPRLWYNRIGCHDPYDALVRGVKEEMPLSVLLELFGVTGTGGESPRFTAGALAAHAKQLVEITGLAGSMCDLAHTEG